MDARDPVSAIAVTIDGELRLSEIVPLPDARPAPALSRRFQIASISKQMVAACALSLVDGGLLDLHEPVLRWLPDAPARWAGVTLHHLLSHTAGVGHWGDRPGFDIFVQRPVDDRVDLILRGDLLTEPGKEWRYSSPGYAVVGRIVERVTGRPYVEALTERVLAKAPLESTTAGPMPEAPDVARGHASGRRLRPWRPGVLPGTNDVWSTAEDVARFTHALHSGRIVSHVRVREMTRAHAEARFTSLHRDGWLDIAHYGYGLYLGTVEGRPVVLHSGDNPGFQTVSAWLPERRAAVAILANEERADLEQQLKDALPGIVAPSG